jgi:hypothetical protein
LHPRGRSSSRARSSRRRTSAAGTTSSGHSRAPFGGQPSWAITFSLADEERLATEARGTAEIAPPSYIPLACLR